MKSIKPATLNLVVVLIAATAQATAQDKPDFSGSWVLDAPTPAAADIPHALLVSQIIVRTNVRGEPIGPFVKSIDVTRVLEGGSSSATYEVGVEGGTVSGVAPGMSNAAKTRKRVEWEDDALVIETGSYTGLTPDAGEWSEQREVWSLDSVGRLHVTSTLRSSTSDSRTVTNLYRRR